MSPLYADFQAYVALRRSMGFKLVGAARRLSHFVRFMEARGEHTVTTALAVAWSQAQPGRSEAGLRYSAARGFARYLAGIDPRTVVPPAGLVPYHWCRRPYLYSEAEISRLLAASRDLPTYHGPMLRLTTECVLGLLIATGLRVGEALNLTREDVDFTAGILTIRGSKFGKSRIVPLHSTTTAALLAYARSRDAEVISPRHKQFFLGARGARLYYQRLERIFRSLVIRAGISTTGVARAPRLHDLRHRFAVESLKAGLRRSAPGEQVMTTLATYLGHGCLRDTYWYISASPELLALATRRLERLAQVQR